MLNIIANNQILSVIFVLTIYFDGFFFYWKTVYTLYVFCVLKYV